MTKIEWATRTWNPFVGCSEASAGCKNCYAKRMAWRLENNQATSLKYADAVRKTGNGQIVWSGDVRIDESALKKPIKWKAGQLVFVNSMSDLFHENVERSMLYPVFEHMLWCAHMSGLNHVFMVLTKRPHIMADAIRTANEWLIDKLPFNAPWPSQNIWLGTSIENNEVACDRLDALERLEGWNRFVSFEPLLDDIACITNDHRDISFLDWAIIGGESGPNARPCNAEWIKKLIVECSINGIPAFVKQVGTVCAKSWGLNDRKGADIDEWPYFLQIRNVPDSIKHILEREN